MAFTSFTRSTIFLTLLGIASVSLYILLPHPTFRQPFCAPCQSQTSNNSRPSADSAPDPPARRLHYLLPINVQAARSSPGFCKVLLSALVHGYEPTILNWEAEGDVAYLHRMKVFGVYDFLTNLTMHPGSESDLVFMTDALDVWVQLSPTSLIARFEELDTDKVVVGAEKACWPNPWESPACQDVPESPLPKGTYGSVPGPEGNYLPHTRPRWANSGVVIGSVKAMLELYKDLVEIFRDPNAQHAGDQGPFNDMLSARRISLDYRSRLFYQTAAANPRDNTHFLNTPHYIDPAVPHELYPPLLHLAPTGEVPVAIHFNDHNEKGLIDEWWGKFWWNKLQGEDQRFRGIVVSRLEDAKINFAGSESRQTPWKKICPTQMFDP